MSSPIRLTEDQKKALREQLHTYFLEEWDEDIGRIRQDGVLELFLERLAPVIYDKALDDAKRWFTARMNDLENDYYLMYKE